MHQIQFFTIPILTPFRNYWTQATSKDAEKMRPAPYGAGRIQVMKG